MKDDTELLRQFLRADGEDAFSELVSRYVNLVHAAATRQVGQDRHLAWDVTQGVFLLLAQKAASLAGRRTIAPWLYTTTRFVAKRAMRGQQRWSARNLEVYEMQTLEAEPDWQRLAPVLDEVMHELNDSDREAILIRYFEERPLAIVGEKLGISEEAARKRVDRALEKLRGRLSLRGIGSAGAALAAVVSANASPAAPAGLAATAASGALAAVGSGLGGSSDFLLLATKLKLAALVAVSLGALYVALRHSTKVPDSASIAAKAFRVQPLAGSEVPPVPIASAVTSAESIQRTNQSPAAPPPEIPTAPDPAGLVLTEDPAVISKLPLNDRIGPVRAPDADLTLLIRLLEVASGREVVKSDALPGDYSLDNLSFQLSSRSDFITFLLANLKVRNIAVGTMRPDKLFLTRAGPSEGSSTSRE